MLMTGAVLAALTGAVTASAQDNAVAPVTPPVIVPSPVPTSTPEPTPEATPTPDPVAVPSGRASPVVVPRAVPTPTPTPTPTLTPRPIRGPVPTLTPQGQATPVAPAAARVLTPVPDRVERASPAGEGGAGWVWAVVLGGLGLLAGVVVLLLRRWKNQAQTELIEPVAPEDATPIVPAPIATALGLQYRPVRIGLNLISATVDGEIVVEAGGAAEDVRVRVALLGVAAGHETAVAAVHDEGGGRLVVPPFALAAGEARRLRAVAGLAREAIAPLQAGGRAMFVPLVAITIAWRDAGGGHRRTQAFAVGVERVDSAKLAPVWLDDGARGYDSVAARVHGPALG